jgi:nicotinamide mononucleotide adenylyltransferase
MTLAQQKLIVESARQKLESRINSAIDTAEIAWEANKKATQLIGIYNDEYQGEAELKKMINAMYVWKAKLENLANAAKKIRIRNA